MKARVADIRVALRDLRKELADVQWCMFGAQAVGVWSEPRATRDIDITAQIDDPQSFLTRLVSNRRFGLVFSMTQSRELATLSRVVPVVHIATKTPVDIVFAGSDLEERIIANAKKARLGGVTIPVARPEHLIVQKVLASRAKDLEDVRSLLETLAPTLDVAMIRATLMELDEALATDLIANFEGLAKPFLNAQKRRGSGPRTRK